METPASRTEEPTDDKERKAFAQVKFGRHTVSIYRRQTPAGRDNFMVVNYSSGKRRFDSYPTESEAREAALTLAKRISECQVVAASMTNGQAADYASAIQALAPFNIPLPVAAAALADVLKLAGSLSTVNEAVTFYLARRKHTTPKPVSKVVEELLAIKEARKASRRYVQDLKSRLNRFAKDCKKDACAVTTADLQSWLDGQKFSAQGYSDFRNRIYQLFQFAVARGYASDNPAAGLERLKVKRGAIEIYSPEEISKLLAASTPEFLPCVALGAFAGLRSAEVERMQWSDIDLAGRHITVGADQAKTGSRRIVPINDALAGWLADYAERKGLVWLGTHDAFYDCQQETATAAGVAWKANALRHSYISYRVADTQNVNQVALECGNSPAMIFKHYRELVKPDAAKKWFFIKPESPANLMSLHALSAA